MAAFFASVQAHFTAALAYVASMGCVQMLLSAIAYLASLLIVTFGLSTVVAVYLAWGLFLVGAALVAWGTWKICKLVKPYVAKAYQWAKAKVTGMFGSKKVVEVKIDIETTTATATAAA